ncbi:reverse transcriptase [Lithospermum erythrorhizon]|uniref:Reverse transcriptase n=1 Tax=Lithospermum erythrorhizon TaxID=34254 RepID=A0AAV3Q395_LITER
MGLRQGDPLSPYLFIIIMKLFDDLRQLMIKNRSYGFKFHPKYQEINLTNIYFVDNLCIVSVADDDSLKAISDVLKLFGDVTGLHPNLNKSSSFFAGIPTQVENTLCGLIGIPKAALPVRYLGISLNTKHLNVVDCRPLVDKIRSKIEGWSSKHISYAGKLVLINSVFFDLVNYWCQSVFIPEVVCKEIEKIIRSFLWRGKSESNGVSWKTVILPKKEGGLGVKSIAEWNLTCMSQHILNIYRNKEGMWIKWINTYMMKGKSVWGVKPKRTDSWTWIELLKIRVSLKPFIQYAVGNGENVSFLFDSWHKLGFLNENMSIRDISLLRIDPNDSVARALKKIKWPRGRHATEMLSVCEGGLPELNPDCSHVVL